MIIMRAKNILAITVVFAILLLSSCDDFLDNPIEGRIPLEEVDYTDESRMFEPVAGVYATARNNNLGHWANQCMLFFLACTGVL